MSLRNHFFLLTCPILLQRCFAVQKSLAELLIVTVATDEHNDGLQRLRKSADTFGHKLQVFGTNERWNGGEMRTGTVCKLGYNIVCSIFKNYLSGGFFFE